MATGTADVAIMISQELEKMRADPVDEETSRGEPDIVAGTVLGIDPSAKMLDVRAVEFERKCIVWWMVSARN